MVSEAYFLITGDNMPQILGKLLDIFNSFIASSEASLALCKFTVIERLCFAFEWDCKLKTIAGFLDGR